LIVKSTDLIFDETILILDITLKILIEYKIFLSIPQKKDIFIK